MHSTDDLNDGYIGSGQRLWKSIKKYGKDQHRCEVLEHLPDRASLSAREKQLITEEVLKDPMCMNIQPGGTGNYPGRPTSEWARRKRSESMKKAWATGKMKGITGKTLSPDTIEKITSKTKGQRRTDEQKNRLSLALRKYYAAEDPSVIMARAALGAQTRAQRGTNVGGRPKGTKMSDEQRAAQSARTKGLPLSDAHKAALKKPKTRISCLFCKKETTVSHLPRYHGQCA